MTTGDAMDNVVGARHDPALALPPDEKHELGPGVHNIEPAPALGRHGTGFRIKGINYLEEDEDGHIGQEGDEWPTEEDIRTLRKVPDSIPWAAYTIAFVELCERFSYYGTSNICMFYKWFILLVMHSDWHRSYEFRAKKAPEWFHNWRRWSQWSGRCLREGSKDIHRHQYVQSILDLYHASLRCLRRGHLLGSLQDHFYCTCCCHYRTRYLRGGVTSAFAHEQ